MAARPSVHYIVVNTNECQFWQMLATMWMGHYWELSSSICLEMWWPRLQSNDWQSNQHNWEQPSSLGLHEPQGDDKQTGARTTSRSVVAGCDAAEIDEYEDFHGPQEPEMVLDKDEAIAVTPAPLTDDFEDTLLEHSMQHFASMACDADLQVDWNTNGAGTINLVDMTGGAVATTSNCSSVTKQGVSMGNSFRLPCTSSAFELGEQVQLHGLRTCEYNQKYGTIQTRVTADGRQGVRLSCGKRISVKISNLMAASSFPGITHFEDEFSHFGTRFSRNDLWSNGDCKEGNASLSARPFKFPPNTARPCDWP